MNGFRRQIWGGSTYKLGKKLFNNKPSQEKALKNSLMQRDMNAAIKKAGKGKGVGYLGK